MKPFETKHEIKDRILKEAAKAWSQKSASTLDLNAYDPIIDLLVSACSSELEKLAHDVANSRNRIFERLVEILTPDRMTTAQPAYAIAYAEPTESIYVTSTHDQLFYKNPELKRDIFFSPLKNTKLQQASISLLAYDNKIVSINNQFEKQLLLESSYGHYIPSGNFYIGLRVHQDIKSLKDLSFFFDWKNEIRKKEFLKNMPLSKWSINGETITIKHGINSQDATKSKEDIDTFAKIGLENYLQSTISRLVAPHFVTIESDLKHLYTERINHPPEFREYFVDEELLQFQDKLIWIKISFPSTLQKELKNMDCAVNCFPVVNRKLLEKQEQLNEQIHIIPVDCEDAHFLGIEDLSTSEGLKYREMPLKIVDDADHGIYALRNRGVKRFDNREALHMLNYVIDLLKDECSAYNSLEYGNLSSDINDLKTTFNRIKKNVTHSLANIENTSFIFIRPFQGDNNIFLKYWTTDGELANNIPAGTSCKLASNTNLQAATVRLVTATSGGRNQLQAVDSIHAFKEALLTRGKIVTSEDFKNFCINNLGFRNVDTIEVTQGIMVDDSRNRGLVRTIDIIIAKKSTSALSDADWQILCNETEIKLIHQSSSLHPIRIRTKKFAPVNA